MHGMDAIRAWLELKTDQKSPRWQGTQEWYDAYGIQEGKKESLCFVHRALKGIVNNSLDPPRRFEI